ncbi:hypothetical protein ACN9TZ_001814 [Vibrio parahaemolyticus]
MELDSNNIHIEESDGISSSGHIFDHWLYKLACIFYASPKFGSYSGRYECKSNLRKRFQEFEAKSLLISIAASSRNTMDLYSKRDLDIAREYSPACVGTLVNSKNGDVVSEVALSYREGCNKIIHALRFNFDYSEQPAQHGGTLNPIIHLYGEHHNMSWKAVLNIEDFIESAWNHGQG